MIIEIEFDNSKSKTEPDNPPSEDEKSNIDIPPEEPDPGLDIINEDVYSRNIDPGLENSGNTGDDLISGISEKESTIHVKTSSYKKAYGSKAFYLNANTDGDGEL